MQIPPFSSLFLMPLFFSFCISVVAGQCLGEQQSLLLQLKNSLAFDPTSSAKLVHWDQNIDCCSWAGISCDEGRVIGLDLSSEGIEGRLNDSRSLFDLHYLQKLNMSGNYFTGQIPIEISQLKRLVTLDLSAPSMDWPSGRYDPVNSHLILENPTLTTLVQNLSELVELFLDGVYIPMQGYEWCQALSSSLPNLRVLSMRSCHLLGPLESSLSSLQSLSIIHLDGNILSSTLPESFADLKNLKSLSFSYCNLTGQFPNKILQVPTLQMLNLSHNELLQGSLPEFPPNGSLQTLELVGTNFSGTLPDSIGNVPRLSTLRLSGCNFHGSIPSTMASLRQLVHLDMSHQKFKGPIPSFSMAKNLTTILLSFNELTGEITSTRWEELLMLEGLDLRNNALEGAIPVGLFSLPSLSVLDLSNNKLSGKVGGFSNISSNLLNYLDLSSNKLEGPIPVFLFELRDLVSLSLSSNNFSGPLHAQLHAVIPKFQYLELDLSNNNLCSEPDETNSSFWPFPCSAYSKVNLSSNKLKTIPHWLINLSDLTDLDLSNNQIEGEIPSWIWKLPRLNSLNLSFNYLEGSLPGMPSSRVWRYNALLDLRSNQLQGQLAFFPSSFFPYADLSCNNFTSTIPETFDDGMLASSFLSLASNKFYGSIPISMCMTEMIYLDLSDNALSGTIPECLFRIQHIGGLNLGRNNLSGQIPYLIDEDCTLESVVLAENQLEGEVPKSLGNCRSLNVLDVGTNHIKDTFPCNLRNLPLLRVLILRFNEFHGSIGCPGPNGSWPMLQILDLASNKFSGRLPTTVFSTLKSMTNDYGSIQSDILHFKNGPGYNGQVVDFRITIMVTVKGQMMALVKMLTIFTLIDFSCNNFDGPVPEELGGLKLLHLLNLSHNALTGQIPSSLGKLTYLESLDLSSNKLTGHIPSELADGLIFLSVLNLSFNQLTGYLPLAKQFSTFSETSFEGNKGLCGLPLKIKCRYEESGSLSPPFIKGTHSNSRVVVNWKYVSAELGFIFGFGVVIGPLVFWKKWRIWYYSHVDDICFRIFPQCYVRNEHRRRRRGVHRSQG